jgi:hypothetical protein
VDVAEWPIPVERKKVRTPHIDLAFHADHPFHRWWPIIAVPLHVSLRIKKCWLSIVAQPPTFPHAQRAESALDLSASNGGPVSTFFQYLASLAGSAIGYGLPAIVTFSIAFVLSKSLKKSWPYTAAVFITIALYAMIIVGNNYANRQT